MSYYKDKGFYKLEIQSKFIIIKKKEKMPQLDKVTFLSQFFWLCFFYLGFYFLILKYFLPKMSRILKFRKKKINISQEGVNSMHQENQKIRDGFEVFLFKAFNLSKNTLNKTFITTNEWLTTITKKTNLTDLNSLNKKYIYSIGETSLSQNIALIQSSIDFSSKIYLLLILRKIKSITISKSSTTFSTKDNTNKIKPLNKQLLSLDSVNSKKIKKS